jgi:DNA-binding MurR/RpiR family transcriptional regulator
VDVASLIQANRDVLSPAERRVADLVLSDPHAVAFGTVASVARAAQTSGGSVVRLTARLGLDGFTALQERVQADLTPARRRAAERIREPGSDDLLARSVEVATEAVRATLDEVDRTDFAAAVALLATRSRTVFVMAADASQGIGAQFATEMAMLRAGVIDVHGTEVAVRRSMALLAPGDVVVTLDLPRYDRWLLAALDQAHQGGARIVALTASALSPLARHAEVTFTIASEAPGPFDSHVAALALLESLVAGVAEKLRSTATDRLERIETAWRESETLTDE